jgi:hypothetical protein
MLDMLGCTGITDAGLAHLAGIHTLGMSRCASAIVAAARARGLPVHCHLFLKKNPKSPTELAF